MSRLIKRILFFSIFCISFLAFIFFVTNKIVSYKTNYTVPQNITSLITGHSHSECAYNDSLISNTINFSLSGASYFYNYYVIQPLIANNKNIKTVFIEFTNNNVEAYMDENIWSDKFLPYYLRVLAPYIDEEGLRFLISKNPAAVIKGYFKLIRHQSYVIIKSKYSYKFHRGRYFYLIRDRVAESIRKQKIKKEINLNNSIAEKNLYYLRKIISYCDTKKLKVYFVRSPMHNCYDVSNETKFQSILHERFKEIEFLDFKNFPLSDSEFGDLEHLNYRGAKRFSIWFNQLIEKGLLKESNKQKFIEKNMPY